MKKKIEHKIWDILDAIGDGISIHDINYRILYQNKAQIDMVGKHIGEFCYKAYEHNDKVCDGCPVAMSIKDGKTHMAEKIGYTPNGDVIYGEITSSVLKDKNGNIIAGIEIVRNATRRRKAIEKLKESEEKYSNLFQYSNDAIFIHDFNGNILDINKKALELLGYNKQEILSLNVLDLHPIDETKISKEAFKKILDTGFVKFKISFKKKNGDIFPAEVSSSAFEIRGKKLIQGIVRDITEHKQLEESNKMKDLFIDIMHHDILNPLSAAIGYTDILLSNEDDELNKKYLQIIHRNLSRSIELINEANMLSKLESTDKIQYEKLDLKSIIEDSIKNLKKLASEYGVKIENRIPQNIHVKANRIIGQVFYNIVHNAIKYAKIGKKVVIEYKQKKDVFQISVIDYGKGIKDEDKLWIFDRFQRKYHENIKGFGLGLTISKRIIELHNGKIWVEDNPKGGAIFVVEMKKCY